MSRRSFTQPINPNTKDSHQVSPGVMLTFIRYSNRDTFNYTTPEEEVRKPLVVYNDAVNVSVSNTKSSVTSSMSATLRAGDINYATAVSPGDFVFVNMVDFEDKISIVNQFGEDTKGNSLRNRAASGQSINNYEDGFKGVFRIQSVKKILRTDPNTGTKAYFFQVQAFGFTEFNTVIYYDPQVFAKVQESGFKLFMQQFDSWWGRNGKADFEVQDLMPVLITALIGQGRRSLNLKVPTAPVSHFKVPSTVGSLLGYSNGVESAIDIYSIYLGIWGSSSGISGENPEEGFNPNMTAGGNSLPENYYFSGSKLQGRKVIVPEYWNNVKIWSIMRKYVNPLINEMYTTYRVNPEGKVTPSLVIRQKPFTSEHFNSSTEEKDKPLQSKKKWKTTKYFDIPRWVLNPTMVYDLELGKDEAARVNFVQIYTRSIAANDARNRAKQAGTGNFMFDEEDIQRNGLKPYLQTADFDFPGQNGSKETKGKEWSELVSDWVINGHLRESGTFSCAGIELPVSVGDNLQFDGIVYHIESVTHNVSIQPNTGKKTFRTNFTVSFGTDLRSDNSRPVYAEMEHTDSYKERIENHENGEAILPGFSDTQHIAGSNTRRLGEEIRETPEESFTLDPTQKKKEDRATSIVTGETPEKDQKKD